MARARIGRVAFLGPPENGSSPARCRSLAEELLLYDKDGQSLLDDHALRILIALHQEKLTAQEIANRYRGPSAACHRRVRRPASPALIPDAGSPPEGRRRPRRRQTEVAGGRTSALRQGRTVPPRRPRPAHPDRPPPGEADGPGDREPVPRPDRRMLSARPPARLPRTDLRGGIRDGGPSKAGTP